MKHDKAKRPTFPKRAVITGGMPYGNKSLHFGHIGGYFVHADTFARFLRDRIGEDNVIFVSGTDCYGSPIIASYKQYRDESGDDDVLSLEQYVRTYHQKQKKVLDNYEIAPNLYASSAFDRSGQIHQEVSTKVFDALYDSGYLKKMSSLQFYDDREDVYLNGRQVIGQCPVAGCQSEKAYADECDLGHQYMPNELIAPISTLSNETPSLVEVENWYFELEKFDSALQKMVDKLRAEKSVREGVLSTTEEFLKKPEMYVTRKEFNKIVSLGLSFNYSDLINEEKKPSVTYQFDSLAARDEARTVLDQHKVFYRTGKTLVPFRLSGNVDWGVTVPSRDGLKGLTFWVWPESLWAPISFTQTYLESIGKDRAQWKDWWIDDDAQVYQFIGEDNIYFYGVAQMGMTLAYLGHRHDDTRSLDDVNFPRLVANYHLQFMNSKASSSGAVKPPMAQELLDYYSHEQLRLYFLSLGLSKKGVSFDPKPFNKDARPEDQDPVLNDGNLLTNVFNRIMRSAFYTAQEYCDGQIPDLAVSPQILELVEKDTWAYERHMYNQEFHRVIYTLDHLIRKLSKYWAKQSRAAAKDQAAIAQLLADSFYGIKSVLTLIHPIVPDSAEKARQRLKLNDSLWSWQTILQPTLSHSDQKGAHSIEAIPPKYDFFEKHPSQF